VRYEYEGPETQRYEPKSKSKNVVHSSGYVCGDIFGKKVTWKYDGKTLQELSVHEGKIGTWYVTMYGENNSYDSMPKELEI